MPSSNSTEPRLWLALAAVAVVLSVAAGEVIARAAGVRPLQPSAAHYSTWAEPHPRLGWINRPGQHRSDEPGHALMTVEPDRSRRSGPKGGGPDVWLFGDSFTFGYGIVDHETFAWQLQQRYPELRVHNFGTPGYGTYQSLLLADEVMRGRKVDLVVYGLLPFHPERDVLTYEMLQAFRAFGGERFAPPHVDARMHDHPPLRESNWPGEGWSALVTLAHNSALRIRLRDHGRGKIEVTVRLLERLHRVAGGRLVIATLWDGGPSNDYRALASALRTAGLREVNVTYAGPEQRPEKLRVAGTGHPTRIVHQWWTDKLAPIVAGSDTLSR